MQALAIRASALDPKTAGLRALRLARDEAIKREAERVAAMTFWDHIDTRAGSDACHPWTGAKRWNRDRYEEGEWEEEDVNTRIARRHLIVKTFGCDLPPDRDVSPICGDHLCMNIHHMAIVGHGGHKTDRAERAVLAEEFFHGQPRAFCDD